MLISSLLMVLALTACNNIPSTADPQQVASLVAATLQAALPEASPTPCDKCGVKPAELTAIPLPTNTLPPETCMMTVSDGTPAFNYPDLSSSQFGTLSPGMPVRAMVRLEEGWVGFDPGMAQAGNSGLKRLRWVQLDERLLLNCLDRLQVVSLDEVSAQVSFEPIEPQADHPQGWLRYNSPAGWHVWYPPHLKLDVREQGFIVLLEDPNNPQSVVYSIDDRWQESLAEIRAQVPDWAVKTTFTDLVYYGQTGFLVEGEVGPGYGQGQPVYNAYFDLGDRRISLSCAASDCDKGTFGMILRLFGADD